MRTFLDAVDECGDVTSGDIIPLKERARGLARQHGLGRQSADAFFQLALEGDLDPIYARYIYDGVKSLK